MCHSPQAIILELQHPQLCTALEKQKSGWVDGSVQKHLYLLLMFSFVLSIYSTRRLIHESWQNRCCFRIQERVQVEAAKHFLPPLRLGIYKRYSIVRVIRKQKLSNGRRATWRSVFVQPYAKRPVPVAKLSLLLLLTQRTTISSVWHTNDGFVGTGRCLSAKPMRVLS